MTQGPTRAADSRPRAAAQSAPTPLRVGVILSDHFTLSAFALFIDHLRLAADEGDRSRPVKVQWSVMSATQEPQRASCGVLTTPTSGLIDPKQLDYVVVVGGVLHAGRQINEATERYLRRAAEAGTRLVGLCTGSFILCRIGLMQGRRACVSWYHYQDFLDEFPDHEVVADQLFVADGDRITCAGGAGTADLACHLIERHIGWSAAQKASQVLLFDRARAGGEAQPHPPMAAKVSEPRVRRALLLIDARRGPKDSDSQVLGLLNQAAVSTLIVLTKFDEVSRHDRAAVLEATQAEARRHTVALEEVIATSAQAGDGIAALREHLFALTAG